MPLQKAQLPHALCHLLPPVELVGNKIVGHLQSSRTRNCLEFSGSLQTVETRCGTFLGGLGGCAPLDILLEGTYSHLECLLKKNANASSCCKARWTC